MLERAGDAPCCLCWLQDRRWDLTRMANLPPQAAPTTAGCAPVYSRTPWPLEVLTGGGAEAAPPDALAGPALEGAVPWRPRHLD